MTKKFGPIPAKAFPGRASILINLLGLNKKLATLIGVGNSICGNSAIAVIAPIIGASATDIGAVIGISAILGATQILLLPNLN